MISEWYYYSLGALKSLIQERKVLSIKLFCISTFYSCFHSWYILKITFPLTFQRLSFYWLVPHLGLDCSLFIVLLPWRILAMYSSDLHLLHMKILAQLQKVVLTQQTFEHGISRLLLLCSNPSKKHSLKVSYFISFKCI